jgi:hypothetical protein
MTTSVAVTVIVQTPASGNINKGTLQPAVDAFQQAIAHIVNDPIAAPVVTAYTVT